jgi:hypothetical protein
MKNIKSIKKLRQLLKDIATFNNETFGFSKHNLARARRNNETDFVPHIAMKKSTFLKITKETVDDVFDSYQFANYICNTHFIINKENEDEIVKVHFSNEAQYADEFGNNKVKEPEALSRLHKFVFDNLDSSIETNYDDIKDMQVFDVTYEVVKRYTKTSKHFAKSYDDALDTIKKTYHDNLARVEKVEQNHQDCGHVVETEDVKSFDVIPLNRPEELDAKQKVRLN